MKKLIPIFALLLSLQYSYAQRFDWVSSGGYAFTANSYNGATDIACDSEGNLYVADAGNGAMQCQGDTIFNPPGPAPTRTFVYKFDSEGNLLFMKVIGTSSFPRNLEVDESGNLYILLSFTSSICELPDDTTFAVQGGNNYILKFNPDFKLKWAYKCGQPVHHNANMMQYSNGSIYVQTDRTKISRIDTSATELSSVSALYVQHFTAFNSIHFKGSAVFPNGDLLFAANSTSIVSYIEGDTIQSGSTFFAPHLLMRCDTNLQVIWAKYFGRLRENDGFFVPVDIDADGNIYAIAQVTDTLIIQSDTITGNPSSIGTTAIYKVNGDGEGIWARSLGNVHQVQPRFILNDPNGSGLFTCGLYTGTLEVPGYTINNAKGTVYIAKYDYSGNLTNFFNFTGTSNRALSLAADNQGSFYVGGQSNRNPIPLFSCEPRTPNAGFYLARFTEEPDEAPQPTISVDGNLLTASPVFSGTIQWFLNGEEIPGANEQTYTAMENGAYSVTFSYETGCISSETSEIENVIISSASNPSSATFLIYPNPAKDIIYLKEATNEPFFIMDVSGRICQTISASQDGIISIRTLKPGIYFLITIDGKSAHFIKQ
jgi:hypothetical protein